MLDVVADQGGNMYILDGQEKAIVVLDSTGKVRRTMGGPGAGPGELANPVALRWTPDGALLVVDIGNARYSEFDTTGLLLRTHRRELIHTAVPWRGGMDSAGRLYEVAAEVSQDGKSFREMIIRTDSAFLPSDTIRLPAFEPERFNLTSGRQRLSAVVPFTPLLHWALDQNSGHVWFGISDRYALTRLSFGDSRILVAERKYQPFPVSRADKRRALDALEYFTRRGGRLDPTRVPKEKPPFRGLIVDAAGYLWVVQTLGGRAPSYDILDSEGVYLGQVTSPIAFTPLTITLDAVYGVAESRSGAEYVVRLRINRSAGESRP